MTTKQISVKGRTYIYDSEARQLLNSRGQVTARVIFMGGRPYLNRLPGGWADRDWNQALDQIEATA